MTRRATVTQVASGRRHIKISAPLLADRLPLYATDGELRAAIFGARARDPACCGMYDRLAKLPTFPKMRLAMGGRHVPSVWAWFEQYESGVVEREGPTNEERVARWEQSRRRRRKAVNEE